MLLWEEFLCVQDPFLFYVSLGAAKPKERVGRGSPCQPHLKL